jgi:hypothetical protein
METRQQTIDRIEQAAWDSETLRFRASKRGAFKKVLGQVYDAARRKPKDTRAPVACMCGRRGCNGGCYEY